MFGSGMKASSRRAIGLIRSCGIWLFANAVRPGAVHRAGRRVVDGTGHGAEVAVSHRHRRNNRAHDVAEVVDRPLVVAEEEKLVADDGPAKRESTLREFGRRFQMRERRCGTHSIIAGVCGLGVAKEEDAPPEIVRARLQRHVGHRAAGAAELGVVVAGRDADRLERVRLRDDDGSSGLSCGCCPALRSSVLFAWRGWPLTSMPSASCELKNCECGRKGRVTPGTVTRMPWKFRLKPSGISLTIFDSMMRPVSVRSVCRTGVSDGDGHRLGELAQLQRQVHAHRRVDVDSDVLTDDLSETLQLGLDRVQYRS